MKALAVQQQDRYQSVPELQRDIEAYHSGYATRAEQAGVLKQLMLLVGRHKAAFGGGFTILFVVLAGLVAWGVVLNRKQARLAEAKQSAEANLAKFKETREDRRQLRRQASPKFVAEARTLIGRGEWQKAGEAVETAVALDENNEAAWLVKGKVHIAELAISKAVEALKKAGSKGAEILEALNAYPRLQEEKDALKLIWERQELASRLQALKHHGLAAKLQKELSEHESVVKSRITSVYEAMSRANPEAEFDEYSVKDGFVGHRVTDISPLEGVEIMRLELSGFRDDERGDH